MKNYFYGLLCLLAISFVATSCSSETTEKTTQVMSKEGDLTYSFDYVDSNGETKTFKKTYTLEQYNIGQHELPSSESLFQDGTVVAGSSNTVCRILCATLYISPLGVRTYMGYLIDDVTHQVMFFHYTPAQVAIKSGILIGREFHQIAAGPGEGC